MSFADKVTNWGTGPVRTKSLRHKVGLVSGIVFRYYLADQQRALSSVGRAAPS